MTHPKYVQIDRGTVGQRIDNFLIRHLKGVPRSHVYRVLRKGEVRVNKGRVKPEYRLQEGDEVRIPPMRQATHLSRPGPSATRRFARIEGAILYEDERLLVIDKPAGLAVHGGSGLSFGLIETLRALRPAQELELVHRLDRDTSGCLVVSKRRAALRQLHQLLRDQRVEKRYLALIAGDLMHSSVTVDAPLRKNVLLSGERIVRVDAEAGKPARTDFRRVRRFADTALVEARLLTGRTHQIRVHAAHLGVPVAGDTKYGSTEQNRRLRALGLTRLFLHASSLALPGGELGPPLRVEAPLPQELEAVLLALDSE